MFDERRAIDVVRTFANYAIVLMHASAAEQYVVSGTWECRVWNFTCTSMMAVVLPALFLISGYLMMRDFRLASYSTKIWHRVKRLLIPYVAWNATFVAFYLCIYRFVPRVHARVESFGLCSFQASINKIVSLMTPPIDGPTWFMRTLMICAVLSLPLWFLLRRWKGIPAYVLLAGWLVLTLQTGLDHALKLTYPFYSLLSFVIGAHLSIVGISPFDVFKSRKWLVLTVVGIFCHGIPWHGDCSSVVGDISFLLMLPGLFVAAPLLCHLSNLVPNWNFIRKSSFFLYTGHFLFCSCVLHVLAPLFAAWMGPGKLTFLIIVFCTLGVAVNLGAYWIGRKIFGRWFGIWDGSL